MAQTIEEKREIISEWKKNKSEKQREYSARYYLLHKEEILERNKKYQENNKEKERLRKIKWENDLNIDEKAERRRKNNASRKERYANDPEYREKIKARSRAFSKTDKGKEISRNASYRSYRKKINKEISKVEFL